MGDMRALIGAGLLACSAAAGDEIITTFGNDWILMHGWELVGQTFSVPQSNVLESIAFAMNPATVVPTPYFIYVLEWDAEAGDWVTPQVWSELWWAVGTEVQLFVFDDIDVLLPRDKEYAIVVDLLDGDKTPQVAVVADAYEGGSFITGEAFDTPVTVWPGHDLYFTASFASCVADVNGDGALTILDFIAYQGLFTSGNLKADCDQNGMLNVLDFVCFQSKFVAGCGAE